MPGSSSDRNLLFGILAVQMDFIGRDGLIEAMNAWVLNKSKPLDEILVEKGFLTEARRQMLAPLVEEHIRQHDGDPQKSLAALSSVASIHADLARVRDPDVNATLTLLGQSNPELTQSILTSSFDDNGKPKSIRVTSEPGDRKRFRIIRPHARGGLGEVYVARDEELGREVALKEILKEQSENAISRDRFVREAEITGGLEHPGIVPVYGLGHYEDGRPYYAMRFIRGASLKEAIDEFHNTSFKNDRDRNLKLRELLGRFVDVCNAIEYAHSRGVLHRDLKPGNIMLGKYGETLVVDWGLAKIVGRDEDHKNEAESTLSLASTSGSSETLPGSAIGTPAFMSPEQAEGKLDDLGPATDVYSLGATLYMLLVGRSPFEGNAIQVLEQVKAGTFLPPHEVEARVPKALSAICIKAMARETKGRYLSCAAMAQDVERWLADEPVTAAREPLTVRLGRLARRHRTAVASAFVLLLTGLAALGVNRVLVGVEQEKTLQALDEAKQAKELADQLRVEAESTARREVKAKALAEEQRVLADTQRVLAEKNELAARRNAYTAAISRAQQAYSDGNVHDVMQTLRSVEPKSDEPDFRSFEYRYLLRSCNESHRTLRGHVSVIKDIACSPDGKTIASIADDTTVLAWDLETGKKRLFKNSCG